MDEVNEIKRFQFFLDNLRELCVNGQEILDSMVSKFSYISNAKEKDNAELMTKLSQVIPLPESFIRDKEEEVDWMLISQHQTLSIPFLRDYKHKVYWEEISKRKYITEEYIREFKDELYWQILLSRGILTEDLKKEFAYKLG